MGIWLGQVVLRGGGIARTVLYCCTVMYCCTAVYIGQARAHRAAAAAARRGARRGRGVGDVRTQGVGRGEGRRATVAAAPKATPTLDAVPPRPHAHARAGLDAAGRGFLKEGGREGLGVVEVGGRAPMFPLLPLVHGPGQRRGKRLGLGRRQLLLLLLLLRDGEGCEAAASLERASPGPPHRTTLTVLEGRHQGLGAATRLPPLPLPLPLPLPVPLPLPLIGCRCRCRVGGQPGEVRRAADAVVAAALDGRAAASLTPIHSPTHP